MAGELNNLVTMVMAIVHLSTAEKAITVRISSEGHAVVGERASLICFIDGQARSYSPWDGPATYKWFKDDRLLEEVSGTLTFDSLQSSNDGNYSCHMLPPSGEGPPLVSSKVKFSAFAPAKVYVEQGKDVDVYRFPEGRTMTLTCSLSNNPNPSVPTSGFSWTFEPWDADEGSRSDQDANLTDANENWDEHILGIGPDLIVRFVNRSHTGIYVCHASNDADKKAGLGPATAKIKVQIQYLDGAINVSSMSSLTVVPGDKVTLTCQADSLPTANLTWLHQGRDLHTVESNEDVYSFTATGCQDSGEYQCKADNIVVNKSVYGGIHLSVECAPTPTGPAKVSGLVELSGDKGDRLTLYVSARGSPPPLYAWSGPGVLYPQSSSEKVYLLSLQTSDAGIYTVNVSNKHGFFLQSFNVTVNVKEGDGGRSVETVSAVLDPLLWLAICGVLLLVIIVMCILLGVLWHRKRRHNQKSAQDPNEHQYTELYRQGYYTSTGGRQSQEVGDYTSGGSTGQYMSIDSADLSWQPQAVQPQDSLSQDPDERSYDIPPPPVCVMSRGTPVLRHGERECTYDVTPVPDFAPIRCSQRKYGNNKDKMPGRHSSSSPGETVDKASSLPRRCRRGSRESDQESEDSESYLACQVVSHGLPPSNLPSHSPTPQGVYLTPVHQDASGERAPLRPRHKSNIPVKKGRKMERQSSC